MPTKRFTTCLCCLNLQEAVRDPTDHQFVERVYCNHLFHYGCLDKYMKTPPFQGMTLIVNVVLINPKGDRNVGFAIWKSFLQYNKANPGVLFSLKMKDLKRRDFFMKTYFGISQEGRNARHVNKLFITNGGKLHQNLQRKDGHIMRPRKENSLRWWTFQETVSDSK